MTWFKGQVASCSKALSSITLLTARRRATGKMHIVQRQNTYQQERNKSRNWEWDVALEEGGETTGSEIDRKWDCCLKYGKWSRKGERGVIWKRKRKRRCRVWIKVGRRRILGRQKERWKKNRRIGEEWEINETIKVGRKEAVEGWRERGEQRSENCWKKKLPKISPKYCKGRLRKDL